VGGRNDPERYLAYRDSLLQASGVTFEALYDYLERYEKRPEQYLPFALKVSRYVDSLARLQDSILRYSKIRAGYHRGHDHGRDHSAVDFLQ